MKVEKMVTSPNSTDKSLFTKLPFFYFIFYIVIGVFVSIWAIYEVSPQTGDDVEHVHSAWLISQGKVPYKDFFQHHNPLLWYLFAPIVKLFAYNVAIFDVVRMISNFGMLLTLVIASLIVKRFVANSWYAAILTIASVFPTYVIFSGQEFRPDNYMILSFVIGLYYLFKYLESHKSTSLIVSFLSFFLSFLFMQKIIFNLVVVGFIVLYELWQKNIKVEDFLKAIILPLFLALLFIVWLIYHNMLDLYWLSNYIFNLYIPDIYGMKVEPTKKEFYGVALLAFFGCLWSFYKGNRYAKIISILWLTEAVQRFFYFSLDRHYYYLLQVLNSMLVGMVAYKITKKFKGSDYIFIALSIWSAFFFGEYIRKNLVAPGYHRYVTPKLVNEAMNKCDEILNGYGLTYNAFGKDVTYYWNLNGQLDVIGDKIGLAPLPDLNKIIKEKLPLIIYTGPYWDEKKHQEGQGVIVHMVDGELKDKYYDQWTFVNMFILKDKYRKMRYCRYNSKSKTWNYHYYKAIE